MKYFLLDIKSSKYYNIRLQKVLMSQIDRILYFIYFHFNQNLNIKIKGEGILQE